MTQENQDPRDNRKEYQQDSVMSHEFDGIQEFDNRLPNWWLWLMWGSMIFALFYWITFQTLKLRPLPRQQFEHVMLRAQEEQLAKAAKAGISNETLTMMSQVSTKVAEGQEIYVKHCVACHLDKGQGLVGPNLTDGYWIHGCEPMQMLKTIQAGVAAKGMPAWMNQLGPSRTQTVLAYILTLKGTNIPGKEPQGDPCEYQ